MTPEDASIVGREAELAVLHEFFDADRSPRALVLTGGPGFGKTTLWQAAAGVARERRMRVLSAWPSEAETRLSFAALVDLLDEVGTEELAGVPAPQLRALEVALLRAEPTGGPAAPHAIAAGFLSALRVLASREPLLLAIDDIQWLDPPSAEVLAFAAVESLRAVWEHTVREGVDEPGAFPVAPDLVEALAAIGELDEARAVTGRLRALAEEQEHPWGLATAQRCEALVQLASGYDEAAAAVLAQAAADYGKLGLRFDQPRSLLSLGRAQRRHKKWAAARDSLEAAAAAFDELGSAGWAELARSELARVGAGRSSPSGELTPTEQRVAELAAGGSSNKEIARTLFVSVRTVEAHLTHAYEKLGVHSRGQLAGRLSVERAEAE